MKTPVKATLVTIAVVVVMVIAALIYVLVNQSQSAPPSSGGGDASPQVVRESSHVLDDGGEGAVTLVEFLEQIALVADRQMAFVLARQNDMTPMAVH